MVAADRTVAAALGSRADVVLQEVGLQLRLVWEPAVQRGLEYRKRTRERDTHILYIYIGEERKVECEREKKRKGEV